MRYYVDFPNPENPGGFVNGDEGFNTREEAEAYCAQWGAVKGKLDLITEVETNEEET